MRQKINSLGNGSGRFAGEKEPLMHAAVGALISGDQRSLLT
jgi:hypothetical protein